MTEESAPDLERLVDYVAGKCSLRDAATVERWLAESAEHRQLLAEAALAWESVRSRRRSSEYVRSIRDALAAHTSRTSPTHALLPATPARRHTPMAHKSRGSRAWWIAGVAASIFAIALVVQYGPLKSAAPIGDIKSYQTGNGQQATLRLQDGTQVMLAPATTLRVVGRSVTLDGEALFTVGNNQATPFTVTARGVTARVLGTEFGVRAYDAALRVTVRSGRVAVGDATLSAGDVATVMGNSTEVRHGQRVDALLSFARGELLLTGVPLREALPDLERWFDVELRIEPSLLDARLQGSLAPGRRSALIEMLNVALSADVVQNGRILTVVPK